MTDHNGVYEGQTNKTTTVMLNGDTGHEEDLEQEALAPVRKVENTPFHWLKADQIDEIQSRLNSLQLGFVDDPSACVKQADDLVAEASKWIEQAFSHERMVLNQQWNTQKDISTEDLRIVLQSYRALLNHLLAL